MTDYEKIQQIIASADERPQNLSDIAMLSYRAIMA